MSPAWHLNAALGIAKTLDLKGGDEHRPILSLCAAQAGLGQAAGEVGLSPALGAREAGAAGYLQLTLT